MDTLWPLPTLMVLYVSALLSSMKSSFSRSDTTCRSSSPAMDAILLSSSVTSTLPSLRMAETNLNTFCTFSSEIPTVVRASLTVSNSSLSSTPSMSKQPLWLMYS